MIDVDEDDVIDDPWEALDFPLWVDYECYNDTYKLAKTIRYQYDIELDDIPEYVNSMKYTTFIVWFKVDSEGNVTGPYDKKEGELI